MTRTHQAHSLRCAVLPPTAGASSANPYAEPLDRAKREPRAAHGGPAT
ncbi:hypothetical protein [Cellulomonas sp. NS3]|nr:hypothetical protein [Cellulomonas sp. NS3]